MTQSNYFKFIVYLILTGLVSFQMINAQSSISNINKTRNSRLIENKSTTINYGFGLSSQLSGTYKLNTTSGPLIVIDGIPYPDRTTDELDYTTADINDIAQLALIPLESIESIELLDYNTNTLIYGSDSKNGVLSITTKKYSSDELRIDYSYRNTISKQPKGYEMLSGDAYSTMMKEAYQNSYGVPMDDNEWPEFLGNLSNPYYYYNYSNNTDWQDAITQTGYNREHYLSLSGEKNNLGYQLAAHIFNEKENLIYSSNKNYSIHLKLNYQLKSLLKIQTFINYTNLEDNSYFPIENEDFYVSALKKMPNRSIYEYETDGTQTSNYFIVDNDLQSDSYNNPVAYLHQSQYDTKNKIFNPIAKINISPYKKLTYDLSLSYKETNTNMNGAIPNWVNGRTYEKDDKEKNLTLIQRLNFSMIKNLNHTLSLFGTHLYTRQDYETSNKYLSTTNNLYSYKRNYFSGIAEYQYKNRYIIGFGVGFDKYTLSDNSVTFIEDSIKQNKEAYNPIYTANLNWDIANESFCKNLDFINQFNIGISTSISDIRAQKYNTVEKQHYVIINSALTLFNRFSLNANYYTRQTNNRITSYDIYNINGIYYEYYNQQNVRYRGWELRTNIAILNHSNVKLNIFANLYRNALQLTKTNIELSSFTEELRNGDYPYKIELNKNIGNIYGLNYQGVYQYNKYIEGTQENAPVARDKNGNVILDSNDNSISITFNDNYTFAGGDAIYEDVDHNGNIDKNDIQHIGNTQPKITGTTGTSLQYKNWWLGVFFNFRCGNDIINLARMDLEKMIDFNNQSRSVLNRWRRDGDQSNIPRAILNDGYNHVGSSRFVEDGSFLRLKALTLKHQVSKKVTSKLHIKSMSLYLTAKNLFTKTNYQGADPDISLNTTWDNYGFDDNYKAAIQQWIFGINISL